MRTVVYVHSSPWCVTPANTDWRMRRTLASLSERFPEVELHLPTHWSSAIVPNAHYSLVRALGLLQRYVHRAKVPERLRFECLVSRAEVARIRPDVVVSQGQFPANVGSCPVLWETALLEPWEAGPTRVADEASFRAALSRVRRYGERAGGIGVRGSYMRNLLVSRIPDFGTKTFDLPFYLPNLDPVDEDFVRKKHCGRHELRILFVGRQARLKGLPVLVDAVAQVAAQGRRVHLDVVSDFRDGAVELPRVPWLTSHGGLPWQETMRLFRQAHVYAMPSRNESWGLAYVEGLASGCVTIARDFEPQRELVHYGNAGILVDPLSATALAAALEGLLLDEQRCLHLAVAGVRWFAKRWHWKMVGPAWVHALRTVAGNAG